MRTRRWLSLVLLVVSVVAGAGILLQRETRIALERELSLLRDENQRLAGQRVENQRLRETQVSDAELQRLRADRAALLRLRSEIESMKARANDLSRQ